MNRPHLLAMPTPRSFGHVAELAPVLDAVHRRRPDVRTTLRTTVPRGALASLVEAPFEHVPEVVDIGMVMASATEVRPKASLTRYASLHRDWPEEPHVVPWLRRHARCAGADQAPLAAGRFVDLLQRLWAKPIRPPAEPHGVEEAAEMLLTYLSVGS